MKFPYSSTKEYGKYELSCDQCQWGGITYEDNRESAIQHTGDKGHVTHSKRITEEVFYPLRTQV